MIINIIKVLREIFCLIAQSKAKRTGLGQSLVFLTLAQREFIIVSNIWHLKSTLMSSKNVAYI